MIGINSFQLVEWTGVAAGLLLLAYGVALAKIDRYEAVDDWFATVFSTIGFALVLVATNYIVPVYLLSLPLRAVGYILAAAVGTFAFLSLTKSPTRRTQRSS